MTIKRSPSRNGNRFMVSLFKQKNKILSNCKSIFSTLAFYGIPACINSRITQLTFNPQQLVVFSYPI